MAVSRSRLKKIGLKKSEEDAIGEKKTEQGKNRNAPLEANSQL